MILRLAAGLVAVGLVVPGPAPQARYDILLRGGLVIDGTGAPGFRADVAIAGGRIVRIGDLAGSSAATELDVSGLVVTPGFVNVHSHASPVALPTAVNMLTQGVTTELLNADGAGAVDLASQLDLLGRNGLALNVAASIGFNAVWQSVMGPADRRPSAAEIDSMSRLVIRGLEDGAFGVAAGLDYKPAYYATRDEVVRILSPARRWRTFFPNHDRVIPSTGYSSRAAVEETREIGERAGLVPEYTHMKVQGHEQGTADQVVGLMNRASAAGRWVAADVYPYLAGQTGLGALIIPGWAQSGGIDSTRARFRDPELRARIIKESDEAIAARFNGPASIMVLGETPLSEIMKEKGSKSPGEAVVQVLETESPWAILGFGIEADLEKLYGYHSTAVACDCGASTSPRGHPRGWGTYPRVLGRYVRERRVMTWEDAIRKMTGLPAAMMGMVDRGVLAPGMAADVTVFDSATVIDHATFEEPTLPSEGIRHVIVNGRLALRDGQPTGDKAGVVLRRTGNMPSRPMDLAPARRVRASGALTGADGRPGPRVTIDLRQAAGASRATGTLTVTGADGTVELTSGDLGVLQTAAGWASITGRATLGASGVDAPFTLIVERADPFAAGQPSTVRIEVDGRPVAEGRLAGRATVEPARVVVRPAG